MDLKRLMVTLYRSKHKTGGQMAVFMSQVEKVALVAAALFLFIAQPAQAGATDTPVGLVAFPLSDGVGLLWQPPLEGDVSEYVVHRQSADGETNFTVAGNETTFIDDATEAGVYTYTVSAIFADGAHSPQSTPAAAIVGDDVGRDHDGDGENEHSCTSYFWIGNVEQWEIFVYWDCLTEPWVTPYPYCVPLEEQVPFDPDLNCLFPLPPLPP